MPTVWKKYLKQEEQAAKVNLLAIDKLTCKTIYGSLIDHQNLSPATAEKRLIECGFDIHERQKIYSLPFRVTRGIKLTIFQYRIIHNFLYTNYIWYKMKKVENPHCPFCTNVDQTFSHLFVSCPCASSFWSEFTKWYQSISNKTLNLSKSEVIYGVVFLFNPKSPYYHR